MVTKINIINYPLSKQEILAILKTTRDKTDISSFDNLRYRHPNVQFDSLLRGYIGEYVIKQWLAGNNIPIDGVNVKSDEGNMDIDMLVKGKSMELKTSLVPDRDHTIAKVIDTEDIKLIRREEKIEDLKGDIHLQIYFDAMRAERDNFLKKQEIELNSSRYDYLYNAFSATFYEKAIYIVGWIDKPTLIGQHQTLTKKTWKFPGSEREFWTCKIKTARPPAELINYLKNL